ncbi:unnamed protein product [Candida verbasci]|uniref:Uncharacterized protein n=1 Tax=Candida verbasci TaxID=1227364 RepID=A0A9W4XLX9_9ASCO|nr:unnamed protein product [Candida verbasci]
MSVHVLTNNYDICVIGSEKVGKSSLIIRCVYGKFVENIDVNELYFKKVALPDLSNKTFEISIFDSDFAKDLHSASKRLHIVNTNSIVFVYSIDNLESFIILSDYYDVIKRIRGSDVPPIAVIGTKSDYSSTNRSVDPQQGQRFADLINAVSFNECSALYDMSVKESFEKIVKTAVDIKLKLIKSKNKTNLLRDNSDALIPCESTNSLTYQPSIVEADSKPEEIHHENTENPVEGSSKQVESKEPEPEQSLERAPSKKTQPDRHYTRETETINKKSESGCCIIT